MNLSSKPYNPKLANAFFKSGMIEAWGRGFEKIKAACEEYNGPLPEYKISASGVMVLCKACEKYLELLDTVQHPVQNEQDNEQDASRDHVSNDGVLFENIKGPRKEMLTRLVRYVELEKQITTAKGVELTGKSEAQVRRYLNELCKEGIIESNRTTRGNIYTIVE